MFPDEPPLRIWGCTSKKVKNLHTGGASFSNEAAALTAALAESLERYIWYTQEDYFVDPKRATCAEMASHGPHITPEQFTSFSKQQREKTSSFFLQAISPTVPGSSHVAEPLIRQQTTIGLATWPTQKGALLAGMLEIIEREALMIMWYNQLTLPQIDLESIRFKREDLDKLLDSCKRYNLSVHAIPMMTDSPTHAVCVILEDRSGVAPRFAIGLKAHRSLPYAVERALTEALRARLGYRNFFLQGGSWDPNTPIEEIGHIERLHYWGVPTNAERLSFLIAGEKIPYTFDAPWEQDSEEKHLERVISWCREKKFECVSVALTNSKINPTPWHIEMVVMPDLHPTHLNEKRRHLGGTRLTDVPKYFGFTPRSTPFVDSPHPYA
jgi:ribosomal protein S12 methylthiotransferase accessory factor